MSRFALLVSAIAVWSLAGASVLAQQTGALPTVPLTRDVNAALGLGASHVVHVAIHGRTGERQFVSLDLGLLLELTPHTVRSPKFRVFSRRAGGRLVLEPRGKTRTVHGRVVGIARSQVAGSVLDDGLHAKLWFPSGEFWIEPAARHLPRAPAGAHVLYRSADVLRKRHGCGSDLLARAAPRIAPLPRGGGGSPQATKVAELACDADYEYYSSYGSVTATTDRIENVIEIVNAQFLRDLDITYQITDIFMQTVSGPPYTSTDATALLHEFRSHWLANHTAVQRDIAHLFTGKELNGATIGTAWVGVVCDSSLGYGLVQSDFNNKLLACATDLSAHELGHNWNADHCQCSGYTMNPLITCANRFHPSYSIKEMRRFINRLKCLDSGGGGNGTSLHVSSITVSTQGNKRLRGKAIVKIVDDLGSSVEGATVTGNFTGTFNETRSGTTDSNGEATILTSGATKNAVSVQFCVTDVTGPLPYISGNNVETCDNN